MLDPFADITQADPRMATFDLRDVEAHPIVDHGQSQGLARAEQGDGDTFRPGVSLDVGQRFLGNAEQRDGGAVFQATIEFVAPVGNLQATALLEFCRELADGGRQAQGVEQ